MKKIVMSVLAVAALGITSLATGTAGAGTWFGSGWYPVGTFRGFSTPGSCSGCVGGVFTAVFAAGPTYAPSGETVSENETGAVTQPGTKLTNPTCHTAFTQCGDMSYIIAPYVCSNTAGGAATATVNPVGGFYSGGTDTSYCPAGQPMINGGVAVYQW